MKSLNRLFTSDVGEKVILYFSLQGDSGGPLSIIDDDGQPTQVGVASFVSSSGCHTDFPAGKLDKFVPNMKLTLSLLNYVCKIQLYLLFGKNRHFIYIYRYKKNWRSVHSVH